MAIARIQPGAPGAYAQQEAYRMSWTPERIGELEKLWAEGLSTAEIGRRLGVSKNAVVGKAHRLRLPGRQSPIDPNRRRANGRSECVHSHTTTGSHAADVRRVWQVAYQFIGHVCFKGRPGR